MSEELQQQPDKHEIMRDNKGKFLPGQSAHPQGRPKGKTIKEQVREYLKEHPEEEKKFIKHFILKNRELAWQMLEGRPQQQVEIEANITNDLSEDQVNELFKRIDKRREGQSLPSGEA